MKNKKFRENKLTHMYKCIVFSPMWKNNGIIVAQCGKTRNSLACHAYFFHQINLWQSSLVKR